MAGQRLLVVGLLCLCRALAEDVCDAGGCGDEGSLLALRHAKAKAIATDLSTRDSPSMNATMLEATEFVSYLLVFPFKNSTVAWSVASAALLQCLANTTDAAPDSYTCEPPQEELVAALEAVPGRFGYNCTASEILYTASQLRANHATWFAGQYPFQHAGSDKTGNLILYTNTSGIFVTVDGKAVKKPTWTANCTADMDPLCMHSPNVLSWKAADGNPTSGSLRFAFASNYSVTRLPADAYVGPMFVGSIAGQGASLAQGGAGGDVKGVMFQAADVACGTSGQATDGFVTKSAPLSCLSGMYCTRAVNMNTSEVAEHLYNLTIGSDFLEVAGVKVKNFKFTSNGLMFWNSESQPWSGTLTLRKGGSMPQLGGVVRKAPEYTSYNFTGYAASGASDCAMAPLQLNAQWWTGQPTWAKWLEGVGVTGVAALLIRWGVGALQRGFDRDVAEMQRWVAEAQAERARGQAEMEAVGVPEPVPDPVRDNPEVIAIEEELAENAARQRRVDERLRELSEARGNYVPGEAEYQMRLGDDLTNQRYALEHRLERAERRAARGEAGPPIDRHARENAEVGEALSNPDQMDPDVYEGMEASDVLFNENFLVNQRANVLAAEQAEVRAEEARSQEVLDDPNAPEALRDQAEADLAMQRDRAQMIEDSQAQVDAQVRAYDEASAEIEEELAEAQEAREDALEAEAEAREAEIEAAEGEGADVLVDELSVLP